MKEMKRYVLTRKYRFDLKICARKLIFFGTKSRLAIGIIKSIRPHGTKSIVYYTLNYHYMILTLQLIDG